MEREKSRLPMWLKRERPSSLALFQTEENIHERFLHTVCEEAKCPNRTECWSRGTATFLAMGKECTRACSFCSIDFNKTPQPLDEEEPKKIANSVSTLGLKHVVITQVARDDLEEGGALHIKKIVSEIRKLCPLTTIELLTSDFEGNKEAWDIILSAEPEVFNYNIETVERLTSKVRYRATYKRTLEFLKYVKELKKGRLRFIKSGFMVGLGEEKEELFKTMRDLKGAGVDILTIGQYLRPSKNKAIVKTFYPPEFFEELKEEGLKMGFSFVFSSPFMRSSYLAEGVFSNLN